MWYVYKIFENVNRTVVYVGHTDSPERRHYQHFKTKGSHGKFYGCEDTHTMEVIEEINTRKISAIASERKWQLHFGLPDDYKKRVFTPEGLELQRHNGRRTGTMERSETWKHNLGQSRNRAKPVLDVQTGTVYRSAVEASELLNIGVKTIQRQAQEGIKLKYLK